MRLAEPAVRQPAADGVLSDGATDQRAADLAAAIVTRRSRRADWLVIAPVVDADPDRRAAADDPPPHAPARARSRLPGLRASAALRRRCCWHVSAERPGGHDHGPLAAALRHRLRRRSRSARCLRFAAALVGLVAALYSLARHRHERPALRLLSVPDADDGRRQRRVPDRRHLQSLCLVRGVRDLVLRAAGGRLDERRRSTARSNTRSSTSSPRRCS